MTVRSFSDADCQRWNRYVSSSGAMTAYHRAEWRRVIERSFGHRTYYLLSEDQRGEVNGVLPLVHLKSVLFGNFLVSMPYVNYGGICADDAEIEADLFSEAVRIAERTGAEHIELRESRPLGNGLAVKTSKVSMQLALPGTADDLWQGFPAKLRSQVRRPEKDGMRAVVGGKDQLDAFYSVFSTNMRDLGTPVYARAFFGNVLDAFADSTWICSVYDGERAVASGLLVGFRDRLEIPWASSLKAYNRSSPNMLLYWAALRFACSRGFRIFDFGRSTAHGGTFRFKEQWGARPVPLYWHYWLRAGASLPDLTPQNPKYRQAIALWRKLPVAVTRLVGPAIVRWLP